MKKYMFKTKWQVYDRYDHKIKVVTLNHIDGGLYKEIEPFEQELLKQGQHALLLKQISYL